MNAGRLFVIIVSILLLAVLLTGRAIAQDCDHTSDSFERFENMRLLPPAKILDANPVTHILKYKIETKNQIKTGDLLIDKYTVFKGNIYSDYDKGLYWLLYCSRDGHLYVATRVAPEQIKK